MISKDFLVSRNINSIIKKKVHFSSLSTYSHSILTVWMLLPPPAQAQQAHLTALPTVLSLSLCAMLFRLLALGQTAVCDLRMSFLKAELVLIHS